MKYSALSDGVDQRFEESKILGRGEKQIEESH